MMKTISGNKGGKGSAYTKPACRAVALMVSEAAQLDLPYVGTEHLLLALLHLRCAASDILVRLGLDLAKIEIQLEMVMASSRPVYPEMFNGLGDPRVDANLYEAIDCAAAEAKRQNRELVGTEHLLVGLMQVSKGRAAEILLAVNGLQIERIRATIRTLYEGNGRQK